ncbi:MAG: glycosyltransferase family 4 protein [Patescibacteria group bacterium]|nr:glycosyltransferase family 4 protein [Patescibacteria group bacterium]
MIIGTDARILKSGSETQERFKSYANFIGNKFYILLPAGCSTNIQLTDNVFVRSVGVNNKFFGWLKLWREAASIIKRSNINVVSVQDPFAIGLIGYFAKRKFGLGLNIQLHGDFFSNPHWRGENFLNNLRWYLGLGIIKKADSIRAVSQRIKRDLIKRGINQEKITVLPICTPWKSLELKEPDFNLKEKYSQFDFIALVMGRLERVKRIDVALKAFLMFLKKSPKSGLLIVGEGSQEKELKRLVGELGLGESVIFIPWTQDVVSFFKGADCVLLTSEYEGWSRVAIESLACSCAVIMTDVGCAGEVVKNYENGIVVPVNNISAISDALVKVKNNPELKMKFSQNAKNALERLPGKEATLKLYNETWDKAIKK